MTTLIYIDRTQLKQLSTIALENFDKARQQQIDQFVVQHTEFYNLPVIAVLVKLRILKRANEQQLQQKAVTQLTNTRYNNASRQRLKELFDTASLDVNFKNDLILLRDPVFYDDLMFWAVKECVNAVDNTIEG